MSMLPRSTEAQETAAPAASMSQLHGPLAPQPSFESGLRLVPAAPGPGPALDSNDNSSSSNIASSASASALGAGAGAPAAGREVVFSPRPRQPHGQRHPYHQPQQQHQQHQKQQQHQQQRLHPGSHGGYAVMHHHIAQFGFDNDPGGDYPMTAEGLALLKGGSCLSLFQRKRKKKSGQKAIKTTLWRRLVHGCEYRGDVACLKHVVGCMHACTSMLPHAARLLCGASARRLNTRRSKSRCGGAWCMDVSTSGIIALSCVCVCSSGGGCTHACMHTCMSMVLPMACP